MSDVRMRYRAGGLLLLLVGVLLTLDLSASVVPVDGEGIVGKEATLPFLLGGDLEVPIGDTIRVSGRFRLGDPTVFYPILFRSAPDDRILDSDLSSGTDSTWTFDVTLVAGRTIRPGDTLLVLAGEALAGADTATIVRFSGLLYNGTPLETVEVRVRTISIGPQLRYIRFGQLDPGLPNPTVPGQKVTWGFRIDQDSDVTFTIYDVTGRMVIRDDLGHLPKGVYVHSITPDLSTPSGFFIVHLSTEIGDDYEVMHVLH